MKHFTTIEADPMALENLVAWLETKPADENYEYMSDACLLGQYFKDHGFRYVKVGATHVLHRPLGSRDDEVDKFPPRFNAIAICTPWTFGAALARARDLV